MTHTRPRRPHTPALRRAAGALALLACLLPGPIRTLAQPASPVTSEGFKQVADTTTFYMPLMLDGIIGVKSPGMAAQAALKAADEDPHIHHAVFMIDSEQGWPLESEDIGQFHGKLTVSAVIRNGLAPAIFPVFFADHIFMTDTSLVGGLPLHNFMPPGSKEVEAKQVGIYSSMLASGAQSRGHDPAIAYAMIDKKKKLFAWQEGEKTVLSNTKPADSDKLENFRQIKSALPSEVLIINLQTAEQIGFAKPIADFDDALVGKALGHENWRPANRFARVAFEIGEVIAQLKPLREEIEELDKAIPDLTRLEQGGNSSEVRGYKQFKRNLDKAVEQLQRTTGALEKLFETHPERHVYFRGPDGKTVLADPQQWQQDVDSTRQQLNFASGQVRDLTRGFSRLGGDEEYLYQVNQKLNQISDHLRGIEKYGNAEYWEDHAKPDEPEDVYG